MASVPMQVLSMFALLYNHHHYLSLKLSSTSQLQKMLKNLKIPKYSKDENKGKFYKLAEKCKQPLWKTVCQYLVKLDIYYM